MNAHESHALLLCIDEARRFRGATAPNPPVGAALLDDKGGLLALGAHARAGTSHAERVAIQRAQETGALDRAYTLVVTLEPCNHTGRTPPCTDAILALPQIRRVIYGVIDPNASVAGGGADRLRAAGLEVECAESRECQALLAPWAHLMEHGTPWVTLKIARTDSGSMIPPAGQKTFTSPSSLEKAHLLRRNADAVLTGSGTILADQPELTVRHLPDHDKKRRHLVLLDRRLRVSPEYLSAARSRGFLVHVLRNTPQEALRFLGSQGVLEVLVEAGPTLTEVFLNENLWNDKWTFTSSPDGPDRVEQEFNRVHRNH